MVPQSVAYAALAGMPLVTGLYAALLPALVGVLWGGTMRLSTGPTALTCVLISATLTGMAEPGSQLWVDMAVWLALLAGGLQFLMGAFKNGWLLNLISAPVMMGFTQAAGLLIMTSQIPALSGWDGGTSYKAADLAFGLCSLIALFAAKMGASVAEHHVGGRCHRCHQLLIGFRQSRGCGDRRAACRIPLLSLPNSLDWQVLGHLAGPAVLIAFVSFLEVASSAKTSNQRDGSTWQDNQI
jgi:SulP family sulfate permease